uniref:HECT and RLD domain containing E3 ubiquitin protein ligase 4 n=1 Tax=Terrapene triunguis TaxID=2587831 RepID=A0A674IMW8_9SAUR
MLCWGNASFGQLGLGGIDEEIVLEPRKSDFFLNKKVRDVGCGLRHTVFVLDDGTVYTCGCNDLGQLGHEKSRKRPEHVGALDAQNIVSVSCGEAHTLALNDKGQVYAWGLATDGQLGLPGTEECIRIPRNIKSLSDIQIMQVACGYCHSLALSKGSEVYSWGQNKYGQLGIGYEFKKQTSPQLIKSLLGIPFAQIAAGGAHSFVLTLSGAIFGWGRNKFGQLGLNDENDRYVPNLLKSLRSQKIIHICCGEDHTAALTKEGGVFTFGAGGYGQLGHNSTSHEINPRKVFELMGSIVTQIACGRQHTSAFVPSSGRIYSFGLGGNGQLGTGSTSNRKSPFTVKGNWIPYSGQCPPSTGKCVTLHINSLNYFCIVWALGGTEMKMSGAGRVRCGEEVNARFLQPFFFFFFFPFSNDDHYRTSARFSGVDMNAARLLFHKLISPDHPRISQQVAASLEKNLIPKLTTSLPDVEALRLYLTLPECPLMSDVNNFTTLAIPFGTAVVNLEKAPLKVLENWWSILEPPLFLKIVELYKDVVVHLLKLYKIGIPNSERRIFTSFLHTSLKVLEILHRVTNVLTLNSYSDLFHLIGVVCGLAIYNFTIVDLQFPLALYKKLLNKKPSLDDLKELMPDVGRSMQQLLDYPEDDIEETFCLNFTITVENFGTTEVKELVPKGADIPVVKQNRQEFVDAYVDYIFGKSVASLFDAFHTGFHKVCGGKVLQLFQPSELQAMVIGNTNYDWKELEKNTEYKGEYWADHPTIKIFWDVFHELPLEKKKQFLLFLTGSDRIPILGMKCLKLVIQPTGGGEGYLPVSHTCFNLLDLPKYTDKETLKSKLIQAIDHNEGFSLV